MNKPADKYKIATISSSNLKDVTLGNLENITYKVEVGGFVRMNIYLAICELMGRILLAKTDYPDKKEGDLVKFGGKATIYKVAFDKMLKEMSRVNNNENYENQAIIDRLWKDFRHGLAHLMIPLPSYLIGDNIYCRTNHLKEIGEEKQLIICDKRFGNDLINTVSEFFDKAGSEQRIHLIVKGNDPDKLDFEYFINTP